MNSCLQKEWFCWPKNLTRYIRAKNNIKVIQIIILNQNNLIEDLNITIMLQKFWYIGNQFEHSANIILMF